MPSAADAGEILFEARIERVERGARDAGTPPLVRRLRLPLASVRNAAARHAVEDVKVRGLGAALGVSEAVVRAALAKCASCELYIGDAGPVATAVAAEAALDTEIARAAAAAPGGETPCPRRRRRSLLQSHGRPLWPRAARPASSSVGGGAPESLGANATAAGGPATADRGGGGETGRRQGPEPAAAAAAPAAAAEVGAEDPAGSKRVDRTDGFGWNNVSSAQHGAGELIVSPAGERSPEEADPLPRVSVRVAVTEAEPWAFFAAACGTASLPDGPAPDSGSPWAAMKQHLATGLQAYLGLQIPAKELFRALNELGSSLTQTVEAGFAMDDGDEDDGGEGRSADAHSGSGF